MGRTASPNDDQNPGNRLRLPLLVAGLVIALVAVTAVVVVVRGRHSVTGPVYADSGPEDLRRRYGITPGSQLVQEGSMRITDEGTVLENLDISGCVRIKADGVIIRNSRIRCTSDNTPVVTVSPGLTGVILEHVEIDGAGKSPICLGNGGFTLRQANVHHCADGLRAGSDTVVESSWVHDLARHADSHNDAVQTVAGRNIVIRNNRLQAYNDATRDPMNAAYSFGPDLGPVSEITVTGNYLDGGNFTLAGSGDKVTIRDNTFTRRHRYGPISVKGDITVTGNRYTDGAPVT